MSSMPPALSPREMSTTTRSGERLSTSRSASRTFAASPQTSKPGSCESSCCIPCSTSGWSSTTRMRPWQAAWPSPVSFLIVRLLAGIRRDTRRPGRRGEFRREHRLVPACGRLTGQLAGHDRASPGRRADSERGAHAARAVAHDPEAVALGTLPDARAVVAHRDGDSIVVLELDRDAARLAVLDRVADRLLGDPVEVRRAGGVLDRNRSLADEMAVDVRKQVVLRRQLAQRAHQPAGTHVPPA